MQCPQLSKPKATVSRNQNSLCERMEKKPWEKPGPVGGAVLLWPGDYCVFIVLIIYLCFNKNFKCIHVL